MKQIIKMKNFIDKVSPIPFSTFLCWIGILLLMLAFRSNQDTISFLLRISALVINCITIIHLRSILIFKGSANHKDWGYLKIRGILSSIIFLALNISLALIENWKVVLIFFLFSLFLLVLLYIYNKYF
ncbi:MAG TPA: hypothetical protein VLC98_14225 [Phnomibacter sp.]|nr:hypothetical protein [Phnomibacter sp.]